MVFLFNSHFSFSETYKWVDEKGGIHFSDDITPIPEKYIPKIEVVDLHQEKIKGKKDQLSGKKIDDYNDYNDQLGRGEEYWRNQVEGISNKLKLAQDQLEELRRKYNDLTEKHNESKSFSQRNSILKERDKVKEEMDQIKIQIGETKDLLEKKIPEEVSLYKAKLEWIK
ncbi:MAG: DUF4124 domain-containing protein [Thermodesulfobacteriota bacterium]